MKRAGFSNGTMRQPVPGKPHIALIRGYWRVSKMCPTPTSKQRQRWGDAHGLVLKLNFARDKLRYAACDHCGWLSLKTNTHCDGCGKKVTE